MMSGVIGQVMPRHCPLTAMLRVPIVNRAQMQLHGLAREESEPDHEEAGRKPCKRVPRHAGNYYRPGDLASANTRGFHERGNAIMILSYREFVTGAILVRPLGAQMIKNGFLAALVVAVATGCGGPASVDSGPTQNVQAYFAGTDATGALHVHVYFVQTGHNLVQLSPCIPQDDCRIYPFSIQGQTELGSQFAVDIASGSGTFADPGITFTVTTTNGKTFTFTGTVTGSQQMVGTISGATHAASSIQLDKQP
jgi:hypothetical protein